VVFVVTGGATCYLSTYKTLEVAVRKRDYALIEKRLKFNLLGVGIDNGWVEQYSGGTARHSLLLVAKTNEI
jgi:hypothetical protein